MSGAQGSLNNSEFPVVTIGKESGLSLRSSRAWPSHPAHRLSHSLRNETKALLLADTLLPPCLLVEKGRSVSVAPFRPSCSGVVIYFKALQDEGLCKCGTVINVG